MNRLGRVVIAFLLIMGALWAGGVAQAKREPGAVGVCVDSASGQVRQVNSGGRCVGKIQNWSASNPAPLLCWKASSVDVSNQSRSVSVAPKSGCVGSNRAVPVGKAVVLCADGKSGVLRWPVTGTCASGNQETTVRSVVTTTTTVAPTTTTTTTATTVAPTTTTTTTVAPTTTTTVAPITTTTVAPITTTTVTATTTTVALTCANGGVCAVGNDGPGGGIVFYASASTFASPGSTCNTAGVGGISTCKYLEAAPSDQSSGIIWATSTLICYNSGSSSSTSNCNANSIYSGDSTAQSTSRASSTAIGMGMANTNQIYARLTTAGSVATTDYAAGVAWAYTNNSKTDWFVPSKDELNELCKYAKNTGQDAGGGTACTGGSAATARGFSTGAYWSSSEFGGSAARDQDFSTGAQSLNGKVVTSYLRAVRAF